ncbi:MAG: hypothetical protein PHR82_00840 [Endomicrobiaceae bacterium]|nr:hypothetical protein [Endomicrobiaceae bacterium]
MKKIILILILMSAVTTVLQAEVKVFPNPWIPESGQSLASTGDTKKHGSLDADGWIKFEFIDYATEPVSSGELVIYDVLGNLIRRKAWTLPEYVPLPNTNTTEDRDHTIHWDGKDNGYNFVPSGVYIWIIYVDGGKKYKGKLVIIR